MIIISDEIVLLKNYNEKIISQYAKKFSNMELLDPAYEKISDYDINTIDFNFTSIKALYNETKGTIIDLFGLIVEVESGSFKSNSDGRNNERKTIKIIGQKQIVLDVTLWNDQVITKYFYNYNNIF